MEEKDFFVFWIEQLYIYYKNEYKQFRKDASSTWMIEKIIIIIMMYHFLLDLTKLQDFVILSKNITIRKKKISVIGFFHFFSALRKTKVNSTPSPPFS